MHTTTKAALAALALAGAAAIATPAAAQQFGLSIGPNGGVSFSYDTGGYCDQWGCPDDFWDMPVYYGSVFYAGQWYDGPVYYRDWRGGREYWIHGQWRRDEWRGPRPGWWREGRYGPPLGMDYYRQHNFHGRWDHDRGNYRGGGFAPGDRRDFNPGDRGRDFGPGDRGRDFGPRNDDRGQNFGPRGDDRGGDRRNGFNGPPNNAPANQPAPQGRPQQNGAPAAPGAFDPRLGRGQRYDRPAGAPAPAAAPAPAPAPAAAPAAAPPAGNGDHHDRRGDRPQQ